MNSDETRLMQPGARHEAGDNHTVAAKSCILVVDDEPDAVSLVAGALVAEGFEVASASTGSGALELARANQPSLIILDLLMSGISGLEVCKALKGSERTAAIPILVLTRRAAEVDKVVAFELGVDDFVTKPFSPRELILRVKAILRGRSQSRRAAPRLHVGDIVLDADRHVIKVAAKTIEATATEFKLLATLMRSSGAVLSRATLLRELWGAETDVDPRTVDTHLRRLRRKIRTSQVRIQTVRGFGYRLDE